MDSRNNYDRLERHMAPKWDASLKRKIVDSSGHPRLKRRPGKPVNHPPVIVKETGEEYDTYTEAAEAIGGDRFGVRKCAEGTQAHNNGYHIEFKEDKDNE